jgi:hypothetical protein
MLRYRNLLKNLWLQKERRQKIFSPQLFCTVFNCGIRYEKYQYPIRNTAYKYSAQKEKTGGGFGVFIVIWSMGTVFCSERSGRACLSLLKKDDRLGLVSF